MQMRLQGLSSKLAMVEMLLEATRALSSLRRSLFLLSKRLTQPIFQPTNGLPRQRDQSSPGL